MPCVVELYSGTGSVGRAFEEAGWEVISVDIDPTCNPTICKSVLDLSAQDFRGQRVDLVWGSPPCTYYSQARTRGPPVDLEEADKLVLAVINLARNLECRYFIENPWGKLRTRPCMLGIRMCVVDYCKWHAPGDLLHRARKRTTIFTDTSWNPTRALCRWDCGFCEGMKHMDSAQRGGVRGTGVSHSLRELYAVPKALIHDIIRDWTLRCSMLRMLHQIHGDGGKTCSLTEGPVVQHLISMLPTWFDDKIWDSGFTVTISRDRRNPKKYGDEAAVLFLEDGSEEANVWHRLKECAPWGGRPLSVMLHLRHQSTPAGCHRLNSTMAAARANDERPPSQREDQTGISNT